MLYVTLKLFKWKCKGNILGFMRLNSVHLAPWHYFLHQTHIICQAVKQSLGVTHHPRAECTLIKHNASSFLLWEQVK